MIELKEVTKEYSKGIAALNGINLRIEQGEFVFVVGDSGSGKSTVDTSSDEGDRTNVRYDYCSTVRI